MHRPALALASVTMLSLVAFVPGASALPAQEPSPRLAVQAIKWRPCFKTSPDPDHPEYVRLECADVQAPLDWKKPNGKKISLSVSRLKARKQPKGVVFTNPGGPGYTGWTTPLMFIDAERDRLLDTMDIIGVDVRGTGYSTQASCKNLYGRYLEVRDRSAANTKRLLADAEKIAKGCQQSGGKQLPSKYVTTAQTVYDLEWIRRSLKTSRGGKVKKINWIGYSGGTWLGAHYARKWPRSTGRFVLDSVTDFSSTWRVVFDDQPKGFQKRFGTFASWAAGYDDLYGLGTSQRAVVGRYEKIRAAISKTGWIQITDATGATRYFYPRQLDDLIIKALYSKGSFIGLARDLSLLNAATLDAQARTQSRRLSQAVDPTAGEPPTYFNITCNDTPFGRTPAQQAAHTKKDGARHPLAGYAPITNPCSYWKRPAGQLKLSRPVGRGLPPVLMIHSVNDPATSYSGAVKAHKAYANSRLITVKNEGDHALYASGNPCVDRAVERYLIDGVYPGHDGSCQGTPLPVPAGAGARTSPGTPNPLQRLAELSEFTRS